MTENLEVEKIKNTCPVSRWALLKATLINLSYEDFLKLRMKENSITLDVRTREEFEVETLSNAIHLDYLAYDLADQVEKLDASKNYFIFCQTGRRSVRVSIILKNLGFNNIFNLEDGLP